MHFANIVKTINSPSPKNVRFVKTSRININYTRSPGDMKICPIALYMTAQNYR